MSQCFYSAQGEFVCKRVVESFYAGPSICPTQQINQGSVNPKTKIDIQGCRNCKETTIKPNNKCWMNQSQSSTCNGGECISRTINCEECVNKPCMDVSQCAQDKKSCKKNVNVKYFMAGKDAGSGNFVEEIPYSKVRYQKGDDVFNAFDGNVYAKMPSDTFAPEQYKLALKNVESARCMQS